MVYTKEYYLKNRVRLNEESRKYFKTWYSAGGKKWMRDYMRNYYRKKKQIPVEKYRKK